MKRTANLTPSIFPWEAIFLQGFVALVGGVGLFILSLLIGSLLLTTLYNGRIYPNVRVGGIDLSGMSIDQATQVLDQNLLYPQTGRIILQDKERIWTFHPAELGFFLDAQQSALTAYRLGREGPLWSRLWTPIKLWLTGASLSPHMTYDEGKALTALQTIAAEIDVPITEATLKIKELEVEAIPGRIGRSLDLTASLATIRNQLMSLTDGIVTLSVQESPPEILDLSPQAETLRRILSSPLDLHLPASAGDTLQWRYEPSELVRMIRIERIQTPSAATMEIGLQNELILAQLENIAKEINRSPENARFIFNDETRQLEVIQPAVIGRTLNIEKSLQVIEQKLLQGEHSIELEIDTQLPQIGNGATAEELGIRELVSSYTSYFYGSSAERIQNIQTAAARFHGVLVAPGETFSMAEKLGDVSLDNGYAEALIIFGDRTIKGVGGGVCQVSTTLFRTAFFGGFPIIERHSHAYRVGYYEQTRSGGIDTNLAGLDATVFVPVVDFKFKNDTPYWLLMETYVNAAARTLTWKFYSTSDGREVEWQTSGLQYIVEPPEPLFQENPELPPNEIRQVDWEAEGADVTILRTVYKDGQIYFQDQFSTHYLPWRAVYEYGAGTNPEVLEAFIRNLE
ncbi:MAG: VanW family protein [Anaerolineales bacterium]